MYYTMGFDLLVIEGVDNTLQYKQIKYLQKHV